MMPLISIMYRTEGTILEYETTAKSSRGRTAPSGGGGARAKGGGAVIFLK